LEVAPRFEEDGTNFTAGFGGILVVAGVDDTLLIICFRLLPLGLSIQLAVILGKKCDICPRIFA
jgi:hypothetical protein